VSNLKGLEKLLQDDPLFWKFFVGFNKHFYRRRYDLYPFSTKSVWFELTKLAAIFHYCYEQEKEPSEELLLDGVEFETPLIKRSLEPYAETFAEHLAKSFNLAMEELRISENTRKLTGEKTLVIDKEDYLSFTFNGNPYRVGPPQGKAIKHLHEAGEAGRPDVPIEDIKRIMGLPQTSNLRDSFRRRGLWRSLIVINKKKTCRLSIFS